MATDPGSYRSPRAFYYGLLAAGVPPSVAQRRVNAAWERFREQVRRSDSSEYESLTAYVNTMVYAGLDTSEIEQRAQAARARWERQREAEDAERRRHERIEAELEREGLRVEAALARTLRLLGLEDAEDAWIAEQLAQPRGTPLPETPPLDEQRFGPWPG